MMHFTVDGSEQEISIEALIVAGWTGRDAGAVAHHIEELAALGVAPPSEVPLFYRVSRSLLVRDNKIDVLGPNTSGEAEPLLINHGGRLFLGLASDHTDRAMEAASVAASKQACPKPCGADLWPWDAVAGHLEEIEVRSWIEEDGHWTLYQQGTLADLRPLGDLRDGAGLQPGGAMLCGTFGAIGGVRPAARFSAEMHDPRRDVRIALSYEARVLPEVA